MINPQEILVYKFIDGSLCSALLIFKKNNQNIVYASLGKDKSKLFKIAQQAFQKLTRSTKVDYKLKEDKIEEFADQCNDYRDLLDGNTLELKNIQIEYLFGTKFQRSIWEQLRRVPYGKTSNYGTIALAAGSVKKSRAVGKACGENKIAVLVPCHRILGSSGDYVSYRWGVDIKKKLLDIENLNSNKAKKNI